VPTPTPAAECLATLRAAGHAVSRVTRAVAARRYGCQTLTYTVDGQPVNLGRLRRLAAAVAAPTPEPTPTPAAAPPPTPAARAAGRAAADVARAAWLAGCADPASYSAQYMADLQARKAGQRAVRRAMAGPLLPGETEPPAPAAAASPAPVLPVLLVRLEPVTDDRGHRVGMVTPGQPWLADLIRRHAASVAADDAYNRAVRAGARPPAGALPPAPPAGRWLISDRH